MSYIRLLLAARSIAEYPREREMSWNNSEASQRNLEIAKRLVANKELAKCISVDEVMRNGSEPYDVSKAIEPFKRIVEQMYVK
jgi:hypothetical protein